MLFAARTYTLADGRSLQLRAPTPEDALANLAYYNAMAADSPYLLRSDEDPAPTLQGVQQRIQASIQSPCGATVMGWMDGQLVTMGDVSVVPRAKLRHRATIGLGVLSPCRGMGIGTIMLAHLEDLARTLGATQMELQYVEGNPAARLYARCGYSQCGSVPRGVRMPDGTYRAMVSMVKFL